MSKKNRDILDDAPMSTQELIKRTQAVEDEKEKSKRERLAKKEEKERKKRQQKIEKLIAPILLLVTIVISLFVRLLSNK